MAINIKTSIRARRWQRREGIQMKRKVNLVGQNTLTVSLPTKWARDNGIKKGDEINILEENKELRILVGEAQKKGPKEISISFKKEHAVGIRSILGAYYRKGYDIIKVTFESDKIFSILKDAVGSLIGYEIVERGKNSCTIKSYLVENKDEYNSCVMRMVNTVKTSMHAVKEDYNKNEYGRLKELEEYRFAGWKLRDLGMRILVKENLYGEPSYGHMIILWTLEKISRNYKRMYGAISENKLKKDPKISKMMEEVAEYFDIFVKTLNKMDIASVEELNIEHDRITKELYSLLPKAKLNSLIIYYLLENTRRIQDMASLLIVANQD